MFIIVKPILNMKVDFADNTKEPSLKVLRIIMHEVAEEAKEHGRKSSEKMERLIKEQLALLKKKYKLRR
jgi:hypothetical protein